MPKRSAKHINVTCAVIEQNGLILAAQRSASMSLALKWEFPGGEILQGETPEECLRRELMEELNVEVIVGPALSPCTHHYSSFTVTLYPFICIIDSGEITLHEHAAITWLSREELHILDWAEADVLVIESYLVKPETIYS